MTEEPLLLVSRTELRRMIAEEVERAMHPRWLDVMVRVAAAAWIVIAGLAALASLLP